MKRLLPIILFVALLGVFSVVVPAAIDRFSSRLAAIARSTLDAARQASADGNEPEAIDRYRAYLDAAGPRPDPVVLEEYAILLLRRASLPQTRQDDITNAFDTAEAAVRQRPESPALRRQLGELKLAKQQYAEAREHFLVLRGAIDRGEATIDADTVDILLTKSWLGSGDIERAGSILARLTGFDLQTQSFPLPQTTEESVVQPSSPPAAFLLLAKLLRERLRAPDAADAVLERAYELHPDSSKVLLAYSQMKAAANDHEAARAAASRAAEVDPTDAAAILADARMKTNDDSPAAATAFAEARQRFPDHKEIFLSAANYLQHTGSQTEILDMLAEGLRKYADAPPLLRFVAGMKIEPDSLGALAAALAAAREQLKPDHPALILLEARLLYEKHQWYRAEQLLNQSRPHVPPAAKFRIDLMLAHCHDLLGDSDLRLALFQQYAKPGDISNVILAGLASAQLNLGQNDAAVATIQTLKQHLHSPKRHDAAGATEGKNRGLASGRREQSLLPVLRTMIAVEQTQPPATRDWGAVENVLQEIEARPGIKPWPLALARADILASGGDVTAALAALDASPNDVQSRPWLHARRFSLLSRQEEIDGVRTAFSQLPDSSRNDPVVLVALAMSERSAAGADDRAWLERLATLADGLPDATDSLQVFQSLAGMAADAGWLDQSRALWQRAAKRLPDDFRAPLGLALLAARQADADMGRAAAAEVVRVDGADTPRSRVARAAALVAQAKAGERGSEITPAAPYRMPALEAGLLRDASLLLVEAANDRAGWQVIAGLAADIALIGNDLTAAIDHLKQARACGPDNAPLTRDLVATLTRAGRFAEADLLRPAVAPVELGGAMRTSIEADLQRGDIGSAVSRAMRTIKIEHADSETLLWLGRQSERAGRHEEAGKLFVRATEAQAENPDTWLWLARWHLSGGDRDAAEMVITRGIESVPEQAKTLLAARGAAALGKRLDAEQDFLAAVAAGGADIAPAGHAVDFYLQQGTRKQAEEFLEQLLSTAGADISRTNLETWAARRLNGLRTVAAQPTVREAR